MLLEITVAGEISMYVGSSYLYFLRVKLISVGHWRVIGSNGAFPHQTGSLFTACFELRLVGGETIHSKTPGFNSVHCWWNHQPAKKCKTEGHLQIWGVGKPCTPRTWNHEFYSWHKWVVTLWANPINSHICNQWSCHVRVPAFLWYVCEVVISSHYQSETTWTPQHLVGWLVFSSSSPSHHNIPKQVHCFKLPLENSVSGMESSATEMLNHFKVTNFVPPPRRHI